VNVRKALAVPSIVRKRVVGWKYVEYDKQLAAKVEAALQIDGVQA
jgi:hypothetical protein